MQPVSRMFNVHGVPIAMPRPRFSKGRVYRDKDHAVHAWKQEINLACRLAFAGIDPIQGPVSLTAVFAMPRPNKMLARKYPDGRFYHTAKPDTDNLIKAVKDAMTGIAYDDDAQVCAEYVTKYYQAKLNDQPGVHILISRLETL